MPEAVLPAPPVRGDTPVSALVADLRARWSQMEMAQVQHRQTWQDLADYILPGHPDITRGRTPGAKRTELLYDTTAIEAVQILAASIMGGVTNIFYDWLKIGFRAQAIGHTQRAATWLEQTSTITLSALAGSNFYQAAHTYYLYLATFGVAAMYVDTQHRLTRAGRLEAYLRFRTLPTGSYGLYENSEGQVDTLFRTFTLTPRQALQHFGNECSPRTREKAQQARQCDIPQPYLHCVYPREEGYASTASNRGMPFASVYVELDTGHPCDETGYEEFPYLVSRWETVGDDPYGFGPGHMALPDIQTLNFVREMQLRLLQLYGTPPLKARREGGGEYASLEPLAVNVLEQMEDLAVLEIPGRPDLVRIEEETLRQSIRHLFFADTLAALPPAESSTMTAYEVAKRLELMQRLMGPAFHRLLTEFLDPLVDRVFGLLWRANVFPMVPEEVILAAQANQGRLDVEYVGPIAKAQRGGTVRAMSETLAVATQMSTATQSLAIWDNLDLDAILREVADANGTPASLLVDMVQVRQERQRRAELQQQAMAAHQQAQTLAAVAPALTNPQMMAEGA